MSRNVYGFCDAGCKYPVVDKEEFDALDNRLSRELALNKTNTQKAQQDATTALDVANNNSKRYNGSDLGNDDVDAPYVYGAANPGNIGFKLPSSFDVFKGSTQPSGWSGELEIVYTIQNSEEEYTLSIPFSGLWYKKSAPPSPFGGNNIWTSYGNFVTPDEHTYSHTVTSTMDYYSSEQFTIYFELNLDNNGWFWLSNLKIKYQVSTELTDLNYTGLTIKVKNLNFFK